MAEDGRRGAAAAGGGGEVGYLAMADYMTTNVGRKNFRAASSWGGGGKKGRLLVSNASLLFGCRHFFFKRKTENGAVLENWSCFVRQTKTKYSFVL